MTDAQILALFLALYPDNNVKYITPEKQRQGLGTMLTELSSRIGELNLLETTDQTNLVNAINEVFSTSFKVPERLQATNGTSIPLPAGKRGDSWYIDIVSSGLPVPNGSIWLGGLSGIVAVQKTWVIAIEDTIGGDFSAVGSKYIIVNDKSGTQIVPVADYASLPVIGEIGVLYITLDTGNTYYWDLGTSDYIQIGAVVEGTLISPTVFEDLTNTPVIPDGTKIYLDTTSGIYYKWDGVQYIPLITNYEAQWGQITGTLADQTDLQNALNLKANDADVVKLSGNQTVAGVKTFSSFPVTPSSAPTTDYQAANKKYVDDAIPTTPTLAEVLTAGNLIDGYFGDVMTFGNPYGDDFKISIDDGNFFIGIEDSNDGLFIADDGAITLSSAYQLRLNNQAFPLTSGSNGQVLTTNGSGVMSWTTPSSGTTYSAGTGINIATASPNDIINLKPATDTELGGVKIEKMLQEDYDDLPVKDPDTLYYIIDKTPDLIFTVEILTAITLSTSGPFTLNQSVAILPSIWNKTYDWDIVWRDSRGLHNLRDFFGDVIFKITDVIYSAGVLTFEWERNNDTSSSVTIPAGAKLVLRLSDNAPTYST